MAIYKDAQLTANSVNISAYIRSLAFNHSAEEQDDTAMGDDTRSGAGGLFRWTIEGEVNQAYGASTPDAAFATSVGTVITVKLRPTTLTATAASTSNPVYSGSGLLTEYVPMSGAVGDQHIATFSIVSAGTLTRTVA